MDGEYSTARNPYVWYRYRITSDAIDVISLVIGIAEKYVTLLPQINKHWLYSVHVRKKVERTVTDLLLMA